MRPRLRSYGLISTWTRSPGSTRIRCIRIFPELWARTSWPLSVLTRNVAFLRDSVTVPSSRMACSLELVLVFDSVLHLLRHDLSMVPGLAPGRSARPERQAAASARRLTRPPKPGLSL